MKTIILALCFIFFASCMPSNWNPQITSKSSSRSDSSSGSSSVSRSDSNDQTTTDSQTRNEDNIETSCVQDENCVLVSHDCCPCNSGGTYIAIHKSQKNSYENELKNRCASHIACTAWYRCSEWEDKARCINSKCSAIKKQKN